jgi:valyl-tRNA synthetase
MSREISKIYDPQKVEEKIYKLWEKSGFFNPDNIKRKEKYCNILPPPNANGELHLGHASGYAIMDIFGRFERMNGKKVYFFPEKTTREFSPSSLWTNFKKAEITAKN